MSQPQGFAVPEHELEQLGVKLPGNVVQPTATPENAIQDFWGKPPAPERWYFPDNYQYMDFIPLNHGQRQEYQAKTQVDMTINSQTRDMKIKGGAGAEVDELIHQATVGWLVYRDGQPVPFSRFAKGSNLAQFLRNADPTLVDRYYQAVRAKNKWLNSDLTVEEIDQQITDLQTRRLELEKVVEGK